MPCSLFTSHINPEAGDYIVAVNRAIIAEVEASRCNSLCDSKVWSNECKKCLDDYKETLRPCVECWREAGGTSRTKLLACSQESDGKEEVDYTLYFIIAGIVAFLIGLCIAIWYAMKKKKNNGINSSTIKER